MTEFEISYAETTARFNAMLSGNPQSIAPFTPAYPEFNLVENARFMPFGRPLTQAVPSGALEYPSLWRPCPGPNATVQAEIKTDIVPSGTDQGNSLYLKWVQHQWDPFHEMGAMFIEHYIYKLDCVIGKKVRLSWDLALDGGAIEISPAIWINWHNDDYEFHFGAKTLVSAGGWRHVEHHFQVPPVGSHVLSTARYIAIGITTTHPTAPGIYVADPRLVS